MSDDEFQAEADRTARLFEEVRAERAQRILLPPQDWRGGPWLRPTIDGHAETVPPMICLVKRPRN
jgi:hypothetical protein